ncbi:hypothetical protein J4208_02650 [Candidatus Woesearchaeota archaeon]|nr:hypothetical protein [Candidatus Woesearchaeota archaeon]
MKRGQIVVEQLFFVILLILVLFMFGLYVQDYSQEKEAVIKATVSYPTIDQALTDSALRISPSVQNLKFVSGKDVGK